MSQSFYIVVNGMQIYNDALESNDEVTLTVTKSKTIKIKGSE